MPSGPKKRRAQKKSNSTSENTENTACSKENSHVMQTEITDGVTAVFDEPTVVLPKRTVLLENMLASEVLDFKREDTEEGIKENVLPTEMYSTAQSPSLVEVAEPMETSLGNKINVVGESSVVAAPCVIELDSGGSLDVCDFEGKETEGNVENHVPPEIDSGVQPNVSSPADETDAVYTDATEQLQDDDWDSILLDQLIASCAIADCAFFNNIDAAKDQITLKCKEDNALKKIQDLVTTENIVAVENREAAAVDEVDAPENREENVQVCEVEAAGKNQEAAISEDAVVDNRKTVALDEAEITEEAGQVDEVKAAASKNQDNEKYLDVAATAAAVVKIHQTRNAVSTELVTPEVGKQLGEIKELVEDVLKRLNAIVAQE